MNEILGSRFVSQSRVNRRSRLVTSVIPWWWASRWIDSRINEKWQHDRSDGLRERTVRDGYLIVTELITYGVLFLNQKTDKEREKHSFHKNALKFLFSLISFLGRNLKMDTVLQVSKTHLSSINSQCVAAAQKQKEAVRLSTEWDQLCVTCQQAVTLLPLNPLKEGDGVPPRPPLPQYYDSSERPPHAPSHHRLPTHMHRAEDRKAGSRNGAHSVRVAGEKKSMSAIHHRPPFVICFHESRKIRCHHFQLSSRTHAFLKSHFGLICFAFLC